MHELPDDDDTIPDADGVIERQWRRWCALRERFETRTPALDDLERMRLQYELHATALMLAAVPVLSQHALDRKQALAAWFIEHGKGLWTALMLDLTIVADTETLRSAANPTG